MATNERIDHLERLLEVVRGLTTAPDLQAFLQTIISEATELTNSELASDGAGEVTTSLLGGVIERLRQAAEEGRIQLETRLHDRIAFSQDPPLRIVRCDACGLIHRNPRERPDELEDIYSGEETDHATLETLFRNQAASYRTQARRLTRVTGRTGRVPPGTRLQLRALPRRRLRRPFRHPRTRPASRRLQTGWKAAGTWNHAAEPAT